MHLHERAREARSGREINSSILRTPSASSSASRRSGESYVDEELLILRGSTTYMSNHTEELDLISSLANDIVYSTPSSHPNMDAPLPVTTALVSEVFKNLQTSYLGVDRCSRNQSVQPLLSSSSSTTPSSSKSLSASNLDFGAPPMLSGTADAMISPPYNLEGDTFLTSLFSPLQGDLMKSPTATELAACSDVGPRLVSEKFTAAEVHRAALSPMPSRPGTASPQSQQTDSPDREMMDGAMWNSLLSELWSDGRGH